MPMLPSLLGLRKLSTDSSPSPCSSLVKGMREGPWLTTDCTKRSIKFFFFQSTTQNEVKIIVHTCYSTCCRITESQTEHTLILGLRVHSKRLGINAKRSELSPMDKVINIRKSRGISSKAHYEVRILWFLLNSLSIKLKSSMLVYCI